MAPERRGCSLAVPFPEGELPLKPPSCFMDKAWQHDMGQATICLHLSFDQTKVLFGNGSISNCTYMLNNVK